MYYQKIGLKSWQYRPDKYPTKPVYQDKFGYIQGFAIYDIGFVQTPDQLGVSAPYPDEFVDSSGYVWIKRIAFLPNNINHQFTQAGSNGLSRDNIDYTFRPKPFMEGRMDVVPAPDIGTLNGPIFQPNYFKNIRG